jgi:ubiquinone/menaquinone biosynthesis C-methylase UbiE
VGEPDEQPFLGRAFRLGTVDDPAVQQMVWVLDTQDEAPSIRRLREWALDAVDVRPGEVAADIGSGTGTMARELAERVGTTGRVVGVEPNPALRAVAASRTVRVEVEYVAGSTDRIPLPDGSVDVVWCERVLQHVDDPDAAFREFERVLRPGGRAMVLDSDHASQVTSDLDRDVERILQDAFLAQVANPLAARQVPRQAMAAGLVVEPDVGSAALVFTPQLLLETPVLRMVADQAVRDGTLTREEADAAVAGVESAAVAGHAFSAVTVFGFLLRKP